VQEPHLALVKVSILRFPRLGWFSHPYSASNTPLFINSPGPPVGPIKDQRCTHARSEGVISDPRLSAIKAHGVAVYMQVLITLRLFSADSLASRICTSDVLSGLGFDESVGSSMLAYLRSCKDRNARAS
jgi:hypothetical protein